MAEARKPPAHRRTSRHRSAVERVRSASFPMAMRGYERQAVDKYVAEVAQLVAELEATQLREAVVQRALDEVGQQTSSLLQHAHETAEEIEARARAQAEGRLQRAEKDAEEARREADRYAEQVVLDTRRLWEERQRLIEDMRQLADEVLGVADDAFERLERPHTEFGSAPEGDDAQGQEAAAGAAATPAPEGGEPDPPTTAAWPAEAPGSGGGEPPVDDTTAEIPARAARERRD